MHGKPGGWKTLVAAITVAATATAMSAVPAAAASVDLRIAHFVTPLHSVSIWLENWAKDLEKKSDGQLKFTIFPGAQMGPPPKYYEMARRGQADIVWMVHGFTPGLFPLTEISNLPFMFASSEAGVKTLNEPEVRKFLDPEHKEVVPLLLMTHQPGVIHTARKPVRELADLKGLRLRFSSATIRELITALGATPVGMAPTQMADAMQRGTLDGAFIDYGGAGIAFKMGPVTRYTTEIYAFTTSFCICMNERRFNALSPELQKLIRESMVGVEAAVGHEWDKLDPLGRKAMMEAGMTPIRLSPEEDAKVREIGEGVSKAHLEQMERRGMPAKEVYAVMRKYADLHNKTSRNFWEEK